jgi:hypothetical protein
MESVLPYPVASLAQAPGEVDFHSLGLLPGHRVQPCELAAHEVLAVLLHVPARPVSGQMLLEALVGTTRRHADVRAWLAWTVLGVAFAKTLDLQDVVVETDDVDAVGSVVVALLTARVACRHVGILTQGTPTM